ncbi:hypothetical protein SmJEL517_g02596 [Synchytrium microbalum]|uniref:Uncharacterized protein n=1 Tax=Synchytrium microbalum TaxID=1806994 RepID=A0A507C062_9FUNG|nr:uncharacterized protein SmJEL517_g02596 [Synchytrium microbalum]TPX34920.1 hypothetical protein SmJEL517_g02596 [Synchytrium microbalum]
MGRLEGKTVVVTGASAGIGYFTALEFAKEGSNVIATARRMDKLQALADEVKANYPKSKVLTVECDVRSRAAVNKAFSTLPAEWQNIAVLVNNAGLVNGLDHVEKVTDEAIDVMLDTNVKGLLYVTQAVLPGMKERGAGNIINVGSIAGREAYPGGGVYCASKHAVDAITRSLRMELISTPINVTGIDPGMVETEFSVVRFAGDKAKADAVYKGVDPLTGTDIAECIVFAASRPPHVQLAHMTVFPSAQGAATLVYRRPE